MRKILFILTGCLFILSCAPVISKEIRARASDAPFSQVVQDPGRYRGMTFIWGGTIVQTKGVNSGSLLEVVQNPLSGRGTVAERDVSYGRFLVDSQTLLDPLIYRAGRLVTVAGELAETRKGKIGEGEYLYPVLRADEIRLHEDYGGGFRFVPSIFLGIGLTD